MVRIIIIIGILGAAYLIVKTVMAFLVRNQCQDCKGYGYWQGTRGERNTCRSCGGTGRIEQ